MKAVGSLRHPVEATPSTSDACSAARFAPRCNVVQDDRDLAGRTKTAETVSVIQAGIVAILVSVAGIATAAVASTAPVCGVSGGHTLCITVPSTTLTGATPVTVTNSPNGGRVIFTWMPAGRARAVLQTSFGPNPTTPHDYSFVWPTQKYVDGSGILRAQRGSTANEPIDVAVTLANGNSTDFAHTAGDWRAFLPGSWARTSDPVVAAVGDGASNEKTSDAVAASIAVARPAVFLYLGDVYEQGTFTEFRNHYGVSSMDVAGGGTLWGALAAITQPTVGNHEVTSRSAFIDYWHGRPMYTNFTFGGVLFLDLWSGGGNFAVGSPQYEFVESQLATAPACVIAFWHHPTLNGTKTNTAVLPMWRLLANGGADVTLSGHAHYMAEYRPMDAELRADVPNAHLVQLISGAGGHELSATPIDTRTAWPLSRLKTPGVLYITLIGAAEGGTATSLSWQFRDVAGDVLRNGGTTC